jgi:glycosyltransferase involved in cell wall biosynthesis
MSQTLLILVNDLSYFISHRLEVALASKREGYEVKVVYGDFGNADSNRIRDHGIDCVRIPMERGGINPLRELETFFSVLRVFQCIKPDIVHLVTVKPFLYGGIAARVAGVPAVVSAVAGLGSLFIRKGWRSSMFRALLFPIYWFAFGHPNQRVIVQNQDDAKTLISWRVLDPRKVRLLRGSGVNLSEFTQIDEPKGSITICFAARLLRDKGVHEFVSAARLLRLRGVNARFWVAGETDLGNPTGLTEGELRALHEEGVVEMLGYQRDIPVLYAASHIICLPSYREGLPKALIEAAAASRAIVTTDVPGCRDAIIPHVSGLLVPVKNPQKLADALQWLIEHRRERVAMGKAGRQLAEREFTIEKIVRGHLDVYQELLDNVS